MGHCPSSIYLKPDTLIWTFSTLSCLSSRASSSMPLVSFPFPIRRRTHPGFKSFFWIKVKHNQNEYYKIKTCSRACFACACMGWGFIFKNYTSVAKVGWFSEDHCVRRGLNTSVQQGFSVGKQIIWRHDFCRIVNPFLTIFRQIQHFSAALQQSIIKSSEEVFPAKVW